MDTATAMAIGRKAAKMADKVIKYIKDDNAHAYGLDEEVVCTLAPDNRVAFIGPGIVMLKDITTADWSLSVEVTDDYGIRLTAHPFPAESRLWNGPDVIQDNIYRAMLASLFHDLIWGHAVELARAWGVAKRDVLSWGNGILYALWMYASADSLRGRIEARLAWYACEFSKSWYHAFKKRLGLHCLAAAFMLTAAGCGSPPDWRVAEISGTNAVLRAMGQGSAQDATAGAEAVVVADEASGAQREATEAAQSQSPLDAVEFGALAWSYGGFKGGGAKRVDGVEIADLRVTADGLSYKWTRGGCEKLGASSSTDANCIAALFVRVGGKWRGGKFDWISTSRRTRDFKNIRGGYNGWDKAAIEKAEAFAFVIVGADGKRRTNVITAAK